MSTNVSLGDTPGVSAYFDGQPIQDQQEAELRKEEERQEKELRRLLETELEDFEDDEDFLSGSNSEDDGGNQSLTSGQHSIRSSTNFQSQRENEVHPAVPGKTGGFQVPNHGNPQSPGEARNTARVKGQPLFTNAAVTSLNSPLLTEAKSPVSASPLGNYVTVAGDRTQQRHALHGLTRPVNLIQGPQKPVNGRNREATNSPNSGVVAADHSPDPRQIEPGFFQVVSTQQKQDSLLSSFENVGEPRGFVSQGESYLQHDTQIMDHSGFNTPFYGAKKNAVQVDENVANSVDHNSNNMHSADDDEWMMKIQTATAPSQPHLHHHHHPHEAQQQQLQPQQNLHHSSSLQQHNHHSAGYKYHHRVPIAVAPGFYNKSPQLPNSQSSTPSAFSPKYFSHQHYHHQQQQQNHQYRQLQEQPQHLQQDTPDPPPPPLPTTLPPSLLPLSKSSSEIPTAETQYKVINNKHPVNTPEEDSQYKVTYNKQNSLSNGEEEFYLSNDHTDFFRAEGPEEKMRFEQLEILYRARGREVEEMKRKLEENEAEAGREKRALKHRAAVAEGEANGANESLKQSQRLLQQTKADNSEALGKIAALEKELCAFKDTKEELVKKLKQAESTIETLSQHVTELSESDSVSRARREHEAVVSTLTQRHQRELLVIKEQLDVARAELSTKTQELSQAREQLGEATLALEQAQVSRGETVNRLSRSLEESQRRCQELLQQLGADSAARELSTLRVKLEQSQESTRISEELCRSYQNELKEAKEQLSMLEAATTLGAITTLSSTTSAGGRAPQQVQSADDSMTDLGIRRTLDFSSTPKSEERCEGSNQAPPIDDELVSSLRSELERCLKSNREKRSEVTELRAQVKALTSDLEKTKGRLSEFEKTCADQKKRLLELGELMGDENGIGAVEARLRRDLDKMLREKEALLEDIKDYQQRLEEIGASEARLTEINAELSQQMSAMVATGDQDKADALARCQRTMEETGRITLENVRRELEERHTAEIESVTSRGERQLADLKQQLSSTLKELDDVKALYVNICQESAAQEAELTDKFRQQLEAESQKIEDRVEIEKREWREFIREEVRKEEEDGKKAAEIEKINQLEAELQAKWEKEVELKVAQARLVTLQEQRQTAGEERLEWETKQINLEEKLRQRMEEVLQLSSQLEEAKSQIDSLKEELKTLTEVSMNKRKETEGQCEESKEVEKFDTKETEGEEEDLDGTSRSCNTLTMKDPTLESIAITSCGGDHSTIMETMKADTISQVEKSLPDIEECGVNASMELKWMNNVGDITTKLQEREQEIKRLTEILENKSKELEQMGTELEEQKQKGREAEQVLQKKEAEVADLKERLRLQVEESAEKVDEYRQKMEMLEADFERARVQMLQAKDCSNDLSYEESNGDVNQDCKRAKDEVHGEDQDHGLDNKTLAQLKDLVTGLQEKLKAEVASHKAELDGQKDLHRVEFERAARQREEKFQSELRYFLKEREEKGKTRLEDALKECREKCEQEFVRSSKEREDKARIEFEACLMEMKKVHEEEKEKLEADFHLKLEKEIKALSAKGVNKIEEEAQTEVKNGGKRQRLEDRSDSEEITAPAISSQVEITSLLEELRLEKHAKEEMARLVEEKDGQIVGMALRHEEEEKTIRGKFEREITELKEVYRKQAKKLEVELDMQRKKYEEVSREVEISTAAKTKVETLRIEAEVEKKLEGKIRKDVEDKFKKEMEVELQQKMKQLEKEVRERRKKDEGSTEEEVEKRLVARIQEERGKWFKDAEDYISSEVRRGVDDRIREEQEKRKDGFDKEVEDKVKWRAEEERARLGKDSEEKVKEKLQAEMTSLKKKFTTELGARISMEKSRLEQEVAEWKAQATKEIERDREKWTQDMTTKMMEEREKWVRDRKIQLDRRVAEERKKLESELRTARDQEIVDLRKELEGEMRRRINKEREEWKEEMKEEQQRWGERENQGREEEGRATVSLEEKLKSEVEARTKACAERDKAVAYIHEREMSYKEERQRLLSGLERCRGDLEGMKDEHRELEEKCAAMDRRYKEDMKSARRRREEDLQNLRKVLEREKHEAVSAWEEKVRALREECSGAVERARSQGELEKASLLAEVQRHTERALDKSSLLPLMGDSDSSTILELRDHYLDTVAKIKADVMSHVQEANSRAAATMRAQIRKQRVKVVEEFKLKVKACLKAALTGEVSASCIMALENSVEALSQQLLSSTSTSSSSSSGNTPRSGYDMDKAKMTSDLGEFDMSGNARISPHQVATVTFHYEDQDVLRMGKKQSKVSPPQKDTAKLFDAFDNAYGDDGGGFDSWHRWKRDPADSASLLRSQAQRDAASRTSPQFRDAHPQLDGVDLFDTSNSQRATPTPVQTHSGVARTGVSPVRKSKLELKSTLALQQEELQRQRLSNVPSTVSTKGGDTTPVSSNASSPRASPTPTHSRNKPYSGDGDLRLDLAHSPFVTNSRGSGKRDGDWVSAERPSRVTATDSKKSTIDLETSPKDQMKRMEARVRLANWAKSGATPWTSHEMVKTTDPYSDNAHPEFGEDVSLEQRTFPWEEDDISGKREKCSGEEAVTREGFRVPGPEAEKWVRSHKRTGQKYSQSKQELSTNLTSYSGLDKVQGNQSGSERLAQQERVGILKAVVMAEDQFLSSDESVASDASHSSFVTLEPEDKTLAVGVHKESVGGRDGSRAKGMAGSFNSQNAVDSGLPRSTRTLYASNGSVQERRISPYRKEERNEMEADGGGRSQDYERIRAAVLRGGGVRDRIDLEVGDDRNSTTSTDDEMSLEEFKTFPSKSAERYSRPKFTMPTSTPLVKHSVNTETRAWSEGRADFKRVKGQRGKVKTGGKRYIEEEGRVGSGIDDSSQGNWRHLGGHPFFEPERLNHGERKDERRDGQQNRDGLSPQKSGSLPQHSRRGKSHDQGRRGDDLVVRSVDQLPLTSSAFPSDLSRITQASGKTDDSGAGMWRYRSLEDLMGGRNTGEDGGRLRVYQDGEELDGRERDRNKKSVEFRSKSRGRGGLDDESFGSHSTSTAWYDKGSRGGPVQAMNSEFWERQRSEPDDVDEEPDDWGRRNHGGRSSSSGKIQRSTSEQSLHTLHGASASRQEMAAEGVDALLAHYLSPARSSFDLRPFSKEHF